MARRTDPSDDDWRNVENAKKRKQIQDRLAQRARRQRLREAKNNAKRGNKDETGRSDDTQGDETQVVVRSSDGSHLVSQDVLDVSSEMVPITSDGASCSSSSSSGDLLPFNIGDVSFCTNFMPTQASTPSPSRQPNYPLTFYGALYINGQMLGIPCSTVVPAKSTPVGPDIPITLHPTELQLIAIHPRWIDRFPFPKMRNSLISLSGVIDDEEFVRDMALLPSFEIVPGRQPWDPRAWKIQKPFAEKWGYLFF